MNEGNDGNVGNQGGNDGNQGGVAMREIRVGMKGIRVRIFV